MPALINGDKYYRTSEACRIAGISRSTLLRWVQSGIVGDASHRDRRGWRLFSESDIIALKSEVTKVN